MKLKVSSRNLNTLKKTELAIFKLKDGKVEVEWNSKANPSFKNLIENSGVCTGKGTFFIRDGKDFMDNLPIAFALSSNIVVEKV